MGIDWGSVENTTVPEVDPVAAKGERPYIPVNADATAGIGEGGNQRQLLPEYPAPYSGRTGEIPLPVYTPNYSFIEAMKAGFEDTALAAMSHALDEPDFDYDPTFSADNAIQQLHQNLGRQLSDSQREKLLQTYSKQEFDHQLQRLMDAESRGEIAGQEFLGYIAGNVLDIDVLIGGALGKVPAIARATKAARVTTVGAGVAGASTGAYLSDKYTPLTNEEIALQVALVTAGSMLGEYMRNGRAVGAETDNPIDSTVRGTNTGLADVSASDIAAAERSAEAGARTEPELGSITDYNKGTSFTGRIDPELGDYQLRDTSSDLAAVGGSAAAGAAPKVSNEISASIYRQMMKLRASRLEPADLATVKNTISSAMGSKVTDQILASKRVHVIKSDQLPVQEVNTNFFYDSTTDTTFIFADRLTPQNARGTIIGSLGATHGLERALGTDVYKRIEREFMRMVNSGDVEARDAWFGVKSQAKDYRLFESALGEYISTLPADTSLYRDIVANIKQFLNKYLGANIDLTRDDIVSIIKGSANKVLTDKANVSDTFPYIYAGSPAQFDEFSTAFVGTGEGNVMQGWGVYTSTSKDIAGWYKEKELAARGETSGGGVYRINAVDISKDEFLRWDSRKLSPKVEQALRKAGINTEGKTGEDIYHDLMEHAQGNTELARAKNVSEYLYSIGIKGTAYATGGTRGSTNPSLNYVFFSDKNLKVDKRYFGE